MASFSPQQQQFIGRLAQKTGLDPGVLSAQLAAEEPVGASSGWHGTQDWLNVGITDSGPRGAGNPAWADPTRAADLTAAWIKGQVSIPGFGHAAPGIVAYANSAGQSPQAQIATLQKSGWASSGYPDLPGLYSTYGKNVPKGSLGMPPTSMAPARGTASLPQPPSLPTTTSTTSVDQGAFQKAQHAFVLGQFLQNQGKSVWDQTDPKGSLSTGTNPLLASGLLPATPPQQSDFMTTTVKTAQGALQNLAGSHPLATHPAAGTAPAAVASGAGDVNPLQHFNIGRTDQGVDASAAPGTPILAPNTLRVVHIYPNWYAGQPYILTQLMDGPNKGKYLYVAEQVTNIPQEGSVIQRGQPIARYAPSGTGIEIGWGTPGSQTAAQAEGNTGDSSHNNAPQGVKFRNYLSSLGVK